MVNFIFDYFHILIVNLWIDTRAKYFGPPDLEGFEFAFLFESYFEFLDLDSVDHLLINQTLFVMHDNFATIFRLVVIGASPKLDLVVLYNGHAIYFFWVR